MMRQITKEGNNTVRLCGILRGNLKFSHRDRGENFYQTVMEVVRMSGSIDEIPLVIPGRLVEIDKFKKDSKMKICGELRSRNVERHLKLYVFVKQLSTKDEEYQQGLNEITLRGFLCNPPIYRFTPLGREITDLFVAVNRIRNNKSDYIPCITWGRNAKYMTTFDLPVEIFAQGRIQSRKYNKNGEQRTVYEVSIFNIEIIE